MVRRECSGEAVQEPSGAWLPSACDAFEACTGFPRPFCCTVQLSFSNCLIS